MDIDELRIRLARDGRLALAIRVIPKSRKTEWAGALKVKLAAVPEKGKANEELIRFLASEFAIPRACVTLVTGAASQNKQIRLTLPA